jgi:hypothetical protein
MSMMTVSSGSTLLGFLLNRRDTISLVVEVARFVHHGHAGAAAGLPSRPYTNR